MTGLHIAALTWPCWPESAGWLTQTERELEAQALKQNGADGVNREQAIYYQHTVADEAAVRAGGPREWPAPLRRFPATPGSHAGIYRRHDERGGRGADDRRRRRRAAGALGQIPGRQSLHLAVTSGAALFGRADFKAKARTFDEKSAWLLGAAGSQAFDALPDLSPEALPRAFPDGGYYVMGARFDTPGEVRLTADAGPLGYLGIAAHGHADALALTLSVAGQTVLVDPGTYAYHTQKQWRDYFRGTSAHNTVRIDGRDQSESGGNFLWLRKAQSQCLAWRDDADGNSGAPAMTATWA